MTLESATNADVRGQDTHTYTITNDDAAPTIDFNAATASGNEAATSFNVTVDLSAASGVAATMDYALTGTATGGGTDYTLSLIHI